MIILAIETSCDDTSVAVLQVSNRKFTVLSNIVSSQTKIHAKLPACMGEDVGVGDLIQIAETRPISKMIHFVVTNVVKKMEAKGTE